MDKRKIKQGIFGTLITAGLLCIAVEALLLVFRDPHEHIFYQSVGQPLTKLESQPGLKRRQAYSRDHFFSDQIKGDLARCRKQYVNLRCREVRTYDGFMSTWIVFVDSHGDVAAVCNCGS